MSSKSKQEEIDSVYMQTALLHAGLSKAKRKQVGAVIVTNTGVIIPGYNGTPSGTSNQCEDSVFMSTTHDWRLVTKPEVLHAELNCILKAAKDGVSLLDSTVYVTLSPCMQCSAMLLQLGVKRVVYGEKYRCTNGIEYLQSYRISVEYQPVITN